MQDFIEELTWRGMVHDMMPGTRELLMKEPTSAYVGIDPTADSLHIGHLVSVMMLRHLQHFGHRPIALVGGATGMVGDPSMKSQERKLLDEEALRHNQECIKAQLAKFLDFDSKDSNAALLVNNYDWMKDYSFINFIRDVGKHITVNYMMGKDSVKKRLNAEDREGMSFTEFSYQLMQGYDFLYLYEHEGCKLQMGGSDQWGNITTGTELIRRMLGGEAYAMTCPLITKADGTKFGKTEKGNVWLNANYTSPYAFYQFWLNVADEDAKRYIKIFTFLTREEIADLTLQQEAAPETRVLQKRLAKEITTMVHSENEYDKAVEASSVLFGKDTHDILARLDEQTFLSVFDGVPQYPISKEALPCGLIDALAVTAPIFPSKGECRKMIQGGGVSINKVKVTDIAAQLTSDDIIDGKYILVQKGKKDYFILKVE